MRLFLIISANTQKISLQKEVILLAVARGTGASGDKQRYWYSATAGERGGESSWKGVALALAEQKAIGAQWVRAYPKQTHTPPTKTQSKIQNCFGQSPSSTSLQNVFKFAPFCGELGLKTKTEVSNF